MRTIAVVGFSARPERPSHRVTQFLLERGFDVYPVNPGLAVQVLLGRQVYPDLGNVPLPIDMVVDRCPAIEVPRLQAAGLLS